MPAHRSVRGARRPPVWQHPLLLGVALLVSASSLTGCSAQSAAPADSPRSQSERPQRADTIAQVEAMPLEARKSQLPASFPLEVPVPSARVESAFAQPQEGGSGAWTYELASDFSAGDLVAWYARIYGLRSWKLREQVTSPKGVIRLVFTKGRAQSVIRVSPTEEGARVMGTIGLDVPVADTL